MWKEEAVFKHVRSSFALRLVASSGRIVSWASSLSPTGEPVFLPFPPGNGTSRPAGTSAEPVRVVPIILTGETEPELEGLLPGSEPADVDEVARPLSPTRLQPVLPPEAQKVPEFEEVARVLAEMPRPLKRRGSMEQCPSPALPPTHKKQYQQIISRLFHHHPRKEEAVPVGEAPAQPDLAAISEASEQRTPTTAGPPLAAAPQSPQSATAAPPLPPPPESPTALASLPSPVSPGPRGWGGGLGTFCPRLASCG